MDENTIVIECDCGMHMLRVEDCLEDQNEFYLAMFSYGNQKRGFFARCVIAWRYLRSGKMHRDQVCLNADEANKLGAFIFEKIHNHIQSLPLSPKK